MVAFGMHLADWISLALGMDRHMHDDSHSGRILQVEGPKPPASIGKGDCP